MRKISKFPSGFEPTNVEWSKPTHARSQALKNTQTHALTYTGTQARIYSRIHAPTRTFPSPLIEIWPVPSLAPKPKFVKGRLFHPRNHISPLSLENYSPDWIFVTTVKCEKNHPAIIFNIFLFSSPDFLISLWLQQLGWLGSGLSWLVVWKLTEKATFVTFTLNKSPCFSWKCLSGI